MIQINSIVYSVLSWTDTTKHCKKPKIHSYDELEFLKKLEPFSNSPIFLQYCDSLLCVCNELGCAVLSYMKEL